MQGETNIYPIKHLADSIPSIDGGPFPIDRVGVGEMGTLLDIGVAGECKATVLRRETFLCPPLSP